MTKIELLYPNLSKKAVTFTIDDGNLTTDKIFKEIIEPYSIKGTFNLCPNLHREYEPEFYREFYRGYDIANHTKYHTSISLKPIKPSDIGTGPICESSDTALLYPLEEDDKVYNQYSTLAKSWGGKTTTDEHYVELIHQGRVELEEIFDRENICDFVWPGRRQDSKLAQDYVKENCRSARTTGCVLDRTNFDLPANLSNWSYNACHENLVSTMEQFEKYPDDYKLKFFSFGVHSWDFERDHKWDELREFAKRFGNRPDEFWYASVKEIFDYYEAIGKVKISDTAIHNQSKLSVYLKINGVAVEIKPNAVYEI